jgi:hypothetical protein
MKESFTQRGASLGFGIVLMVLGFLFWLGQWVGVNFWGAAWPLIIVAAGLIFFVGMVSGGKSAGGLAIPGSIVSTVGLILLYQNTFNHYESWSYAWALIPTAVGIGMMINGYWSDQPAEIQKGRRLVGIGALMLLIGFVFFEFVIGIGRFAPIRFNGLVWPLFLVGLGVYLVLRNMLRNRAQPTATQWTKASILSPTLSPAISPLVRTTPPPVAAQPPVEQKEKSAIGEHI